MSVPSVVTRPIRPDPCSVNHTAPSGPAVIAVGSDAKASAVVGPNVPSVAREPTESVPRALNHNAPSGPVAMPKGEEPSTGSVNSVTSWVGPPCAAGDLAARMETASTVIADRAAALCESVGSVRWRYHVSGIGPRRPYGASTEGPYLPSAIRPMKLCSAPWLPTNSC